MTLRLLPPPTTFRFPFSRPSRPSCEWCAYDRHQCWGCGRSMGHGHQVCVKCCHKMFKFTEETA